MIRTVSVAVRRVRRPALPPVAATWLSPRTAVESRRHYARQPSFTTPPEPAEPPSSSNAETAAQANRVSAQAERVLDSYGSPFQQTASSAYTAFRYAVFGSVFVVVSSLAAFTAAHLYVEYVALAGPRPSDDDDDPDEWATEVEGWTGSHLPNQHGGTDPRLGLWTRMAIRAAWMSQNWGSGTVAAPETLAGAASTVRGGSTAAASPFAVPSAPPRRIGDSPGSAAATVAGGPSEVGGGGVDSQAARQVHDAGWIMAERYLALALRRAQETRGISLVDSSDWEAHIEHGGVDRAAVQLEQRLAGIRERIGGRTRLYKAREGWERIYYALEASPSDPTTRKEEAEWERREKVRATRKLGDLSARIADSWQVGSDERESELERAEGWYLGGVIPLLAAVEGQSLAGRALDELVVSPAQPQPQEEPRKHVSPSSSFFGFWSRSHPPSSSSTPSRAPRPPLGSTAGAAELDHLIALLSAAPNNNNNDKNGSRTLSPATERAVLASLISLETQFARRASTAASSPTYLIDKATTPAVLLQRAQALQSAALAYAQSLAAARPLLPASVPPTTASTVESSSSSSSSSLSSITAADLSKRTSALWLSTRLAALETHLSECRLALALSERKTSTFGGGGRGKTSVPVDLADADALLLATSRAEQTSDASAALLAAIETYKDKNAKELRKVYEEPLKRIRRDADKVVEMGTGLSEVVASLLPRAKEERTTNKWFK